MILHDLPRMRITPHILRVGSHDWRGRTSSVRLQTHKPRQPLRVVGYMITKLSLTYAMAHSLITAMTRPRVGARSIGQLALAGLNISR